MTKYIHEFLGTFFLSVAIIASLLTGWLGPYQPLLIGTLLVGLIYADKKISGAHYNPAVTLGVWLRGRCSLSLVPRYILTQLLAGLLAALLCNAILPSYQPETPTQMQVTYGSIGEVIGTFILVYVILFVATTQRTKGNTYYGIAIGYTVTFCAYSFGGFGSLGCFNPAVALATYMSDLSTLQNSMIITLSNFVGGALAALTFMKIEHGER